MQKTLLKWLILLILLAYSAFVAVWASDSASSRKCAGIEVRIDNKYNSPSLTAAGVKAQIIKFDPAIEKKPLKNINLDALEKYLAGFNYFESVECSFTPSGKIRVDIVPLVPEMRIFDETGSYYINKDGKKMEATPNFYADVPVASGKFSKEFTPEKLLPLVRAIKNDKLMANLVTMIGVDSPDNIILIPRIKGHVINIGNLDNLDRKFHNLKLMYQRVIPYKGWETYDTISVKFRGQIVATRADKTIINHSLDFEDEEDLEEATLEGIVPEGSTLPTSYEQAYAEKHKTKPKVTPSSTPQNQKNNTPSNTPQNQ